MRESTRRQQGRLTSLICFDDFSHLAVSKSLASEHTLVRMADQQTRRRRDVKRNPPPPVPYELELGGTDGRGASPQAVDRRLMGGGTAGNERLTAAAGILLVLLLAVIGLTLLRLRSLISVHLFVGLLLIPPIALKMASTGYRFMRYYTSNPAYRKRGTPPILLRMSAPLVVASTLVVLGTGVALLFVGPESAGILRQLHKLSFIVWVAFTALHVLGHLPDLQKIFLTRRSGHIEYNELAAGRTGRVVSLAGALIAGAVLAILLIPHFGAWSHFETFHHRR